MTPKSFKTTLKEVLEVLLEVLEVLLQVLEVLEVFLGVHVLKSQCNEQSHLLKTVLMRF